MKPLVKLFMVFCLIGIVLSRPMPEGDEGETEESADDASGETGEGDEEQTDEAGSEDGGEEDGGDEDAGGEDAEGSKDEEDGAEGDGGEEESTGGDEGGDNAGGGENDPVNTYNKVVALLDKDTKVDNIQSEYLRSALNNDLQSEVRNPVVEAISSIGNYSKIQGCFTSMGSDVKKVIGEEEKAFKDCMTKKKSEYECSEDSFASAKGKLSSITSKIKSCVSSKGR